MEILPNKGKNLIIEIDGRQFARYPVKTKLITPEDKDISIIIEEYVKKYIQPKDIIFISEKAVAITQGRSYPLQEIKASSLARFLSQLVTKTPIGIGLGSPETMQLAIEEVGFLRILVASLIGALGKLFGIKGLFYRIAGDGARSIDGEVPYAIPPYNTHVSKGPLNASKVAQHISEKLGTKVAIVDANDFGVNILGTSEGVDKKLVAKIIKDNPLGQSDEQTPIGIIREFFLFNKFQETMVLRQAELKDTKEILEIVSELYLNIPRFVWNEEGFVEKQIEKKEYFVIEDQGRLVGIMSLRQRTNKVNIETLAVRKNFQSKGLGSKFIEFAKQFTKEKGFNTLHAYSFSEYYSADFYLKKGFKVLPYFGYYKNHKYDCFELKI